MSKAAIGNTNVKGKIWIHNERLQKQRIIDPKKIQNYLDDGWELGILGETKRNIRLSIIKRIEEINGYVYPGYNPNGCKHFNLLMEQTGTFIQHAENGKEFYIKEFGYWVDGYDIENNIVYEYDEKHHYKNGILREKDIKRQEEITKHLNCKFIRIKAK